MKSAQEIVKAAIDAAGSAGGLDEINAIAERGPGAMAFSDEDMAVLVEAFGSPGEALYAIQREAQYRVSAAALLPVSPEARQCRAVEPGFAGCE